MRNRDDLFCYGTLCVEEVVETVLGRVPPSQPAQLQGYACHVIEGEVYPALFQSDLSTCNGKVYSGVSEAEFRLLDRYEGCQYHRQQLALTGIYPPQSAWVYLLKPGTKVQPGPLWDLDYFIRHQLRSFLSQEIV